MKYFSLKAVTDAYNANKTCTKNKFWGLLSIFSNVNAPVAPAISYDFSTSKVSEFLENIFCVSDSKKAYANGSTWNIMVSNKWTEKVTDQMLSGTPNIFNVIIWYFRTTAFADDVTNEDLISLFLQKTNISADDAKKLFTFSDKEIGYSNILYHEAELLKSLGHTEINLTAEGTTIVAHPGELSRAPFIQTLYAGQSTLECLIITPFKFNELYSIKTAEKPKKNISDSFSWEIYAKYIDLLKENKNLILTGAPGTGKTFMAKNIAALIVGGCLWNDLSEEMRDQCGFVQFHPSYDYTDFVEGLRPVEGGDFKRQNGVFKEFCAKALCASSHSHARRSELEQALQQFKQDLKEKGTIDIPSFRSSTIIKTSLSDTDCITVAHIKSPWSARDSHMMDYLIEHKCHEGDTYTKSIGDYIIDNYIKKGNEDDIPVIESDKKYVFIIDEINRGELSKIFGELFYSIEPDYRGDVGRVRTQYNNMITDPKDPFKDGFYIPENVYIIGTMNDIDRGVEAMDFAIRRRFVWEEVTAEQSAANMKISGTAKIKMDALNIALEENGLTAAHHIGGAYFRNLAPNDFDALWQNRLRGIIQEYFRGEPDAERKISSVEASYKAAGTINRESSSAEA